MIGRVAAGDPVRDIARRLGRAPSTISREIKNNSVIGRRKSVRNRTFGRGCGGFTAQTAAGSRRRTAAPWRPPEM
ncbi:helix-turn-helix domain-containing protein [Mycolicibacterium aurum]|uniref:helix-turn-helix domain-containing protein n=1 Tax=Mycolicibacterium aurum TaxID=1791 RepID=UPI003FD75B57